jgi:site-specific recombinase XerD
MPDRHTSGDLGTAIDVPKLPERLPKPLEAGDRNQLLAALPHDTLPELRDRALILLLLSTGARISEILRLDRSDWKPDRLWVLGVCEDDGVISNWKDSPFDSRSVLLVVVICSPLPLG